MTIAEWVESPAPEPVPLPAKTLRWRLAVAEDDPDGCVLYAGSNSPLDPNPGPVLVMRFRDSDTDDQGDPLPDVRYPTMPELQAAVDELGRQGFQYVAFFSVRQTDREPARRWVGVQLMPLKVNQQPQQKGTPLV